MRTSRGGATIVPILLFLCTVAFVEARVPRVESSSPLFDGKEIPELPKQKQPWQKPAGKIPADSIRINELLFDIGYADPRGCAYRIVKVRVGSVWTGDAGTLTTHAWVLPETPGSSHRFVVC
jgi:hypothetical protein